MCGSASDYHDQKCDQCNTVFGTIKIETKSESRANLVQVKPPLGILSADLFNLEKSLNDPSARIIGNFGGSDLQFDFSAIAQDLERELELKKNGSIKNLKVVKGEDIFKKE
jgi:hypothetical protein